VYGDPLHKRRWLSKSCNIVASIYRGSAHILTALIAPAAVEKRGVRLLMRSAAGRLAPARLHQTERRHGECDNYYPDHLPLLIRQARVRETQTR
jgi:hypothetical protein